MTFKLLYLPNESNENDPAQLQIGPRKAFERLAHEGDISELRCFSFLSKYRADGNAEKTRVELLAVAESFQPDVIFWQHISEFPVDRDFIREIKNRSNCKLLVYQDGDIYDQRVKRMSKSMQSILSCCDLALLVGLGSMSDLAYRAGAKQVRYLPNSYDNIRFGNPWTTPADRPYLVSMIANNTIRRIPGWQMPGTNSRAKLANALAAKYGPQFALYGNGWNIAGEAARGPVAFNGQEEVSRNGWITVNWSHYPDVPYYFSNRLPISLAAGVVHVTTHHPGYDHLFADCPGLYTCKSVAEAESCIEWLLSRPRTELVNEGFGAMNWVKSNLEADIVYRRAIEICKELLTAQQKKTQT